MRNLNVFQFERNRTLLVFIFFSVVCQFIQVSESSKVHFVTNLHEVYGSLPCSSFRSVLSSGINLTILGLPGTEDKHKLHEISTAATNPFIVYDYLANATKDQMSSDDIIVFNDGSDVLYATNESKLRIAYLQIERANTILFSAERNCWPGVGGCLELDSSIESSFRYANSGGWIARYDVALKFLSAWTEFLKAHSLETRNDQMALHEYMQRKNAKRSDVIVEVDYNCSIFQTSSSTKLSTSKWSTPDIKGPYVRSNGVVYNSETKTEPHFYHFNHDTNILVEVEKLMWDSRRQKGRVPPTYSTNCNQLLNTYPAVNVCRYDRNIAKRIKFSCNEPKAINKDSRSRVKSASKSTETTLYPSRIGTFPIRNDVTTGVAVARGRLMMLRKGERYTLSEYKSILQCPKLQPELYGRGGALSLAKHIPLTKDTLLLVAAFLETSCTLWNGCRESVKVLQSGVFENTGNSHYLGSFSNTKMLRIINGTLYYDWPWGIERIRVDSQDENYRLLFKHVTDWVSDLPDSVFFAGSETAALPPNIPVPHFSCSPKGSSSSDIPGPWTAPFRFEEERYSAGKYRTIVQDYEASTVSSNSKVSDMDPDTTSSMNVHDEIENFQSLQIASSSWEARIDKAAFFGSMSNEGLNDHSVARQIVVNIGLDHPQHVTANYTLCFLLTDVNPASETPVECNIDFAEWKAKHSQPPAEPEPFGFGDRSIRARIPDRVDFEKYMLSYRYLIVIGGISAADRLNTFLAHSGAVILLQEADFLYHYSAFLKPWVHYVPLAFNAADLLEKVLWLKAHPKQAERLAQNARNFGASYLRLEDYYCYSAAALEAVGDIATPSALMPFNATILPVLRTST